MKRMFQTRRQATDALLLELEQAFPDTEFHAVPGEFLPTDVQHLFYYRVYHDLTRTRLKQAVRIHWSDGPTVEQVKKIVAPYERYRKVVQEDGSLEVFENVVFDTDGSVRRCGMFSTVMFVRDACECCKQQEQAARLVTWPTANTRVSSLCWPELEGGNQCSL